MMSLEYNTHDEFKQVAMGLPGKGGRAKRTPYQCKTKRIPVELEPQIDELISGFVEGVESGDRTLHTPTYTADQYQLLAGKLHEVEMELQAKNQQIIEEREKSWKESGELVARCNKLQQQLDDESYQRLHGKIYELEQNLATKHKQMLDQRDKLWKENRDLQEQRDKFQRWAEQMGREIKQLRDSQPDNDEVRSLRDDSRRSLPDAAELLQCLRGKLPKSKANLKDVESLLDLMSD